MLLEVSSDPIVVEQGIIDVEEEYDRGELHVIQTPASGCSERNCTLSEA